MVATRFKRHKHRRTSGAGAGGLKGFSLGMRPAKHGVIAFANDLIVCDDDTSDHRIGFDHPRPRVANSRARCINSLSRAEKADIM